MNTTAIARLKQFPGAFHESANVISRMPGLIRAYLDAKGYNVATVRKLDKAVGEFVPMFYELVLKSNMPSVDTRMARYFMDLATDPKIIHGMEDEFYLGTPQQNRQIDAAIAHVPYTVRRNFHGIGAADNVTISTDYATRIAHTDVVPDIRDTPIAIIGYGPAGLLVTAGLKRLGWNMSKVTVYNNHSKPGGIWQHPNVYQGSRNNPRLLQYLGFILESAPGEGGEVRRFTDRLANYAGGDGDMTPRKANVKSVVPHDFIHRVYTADGQEPEKFPIVVNCMGTGKPRPLCDEKRMLTSATATEAGERWQTIVERKKVERTRTVMIGLGNSTAEMMVQFEGLIRDGVDIDYKVLTHYSEDALHNPEANVNGTRIFRDLAEPNLVDFAGDMPDVRNAYFSALHAGRIESGVKYWAKSAKTVGWRVRKQHGKKTSYGGSISADRMFTLTGYSTPVSTYASMGIPTNTDGEPLYDFDGEFHAGRPADYSSRQVQARHENRIWKGYFGLGPVLDTSWNRNATVIPGMLHRIGDLLFGIIMRATEYQEAQKV